MCSRAQKTGDNSLGFPHISCYLGITISLPKGSGRGGGAPVWTSECVGRASGHRSVPRFCIAMEVTWRATHPAGHLVLLGGSLIGPGGLPFIFSRKEETDWVIPARWVD